MWLFFSSAGFLLLIFFSTPASLRKCLTASVRYDFLPHALVWCP